MNQKQEVPVANAADEAQVNRAKKDEKYGRERELSDLNELMSSPTGRRFIWAHLSRCGVYRSSFAPDSHLTAFHEGRREIGLSLLNDILEIAPEKYTLMADEAQKGKEQWQQKKPPKIQ